MTENKKKPPAPFRHAACATLVLASLFAAFLGPSSLLAAEIQFRSYAQTLPPLGLPPALFGGEIRVPAARPPAAGPAYANTGAGVEDLFAGPQGRLRLRPAHLGGM